MLGPVNTSPSRKNRRVSGVSGRGSSTGRLVVVVA
jgi:hypothetical protein